MNVAARISCLFLVLAVGHVTGKALFNPSVCMARNVISDYMDGTADADPLRAVAELRKVHEQHSSVQLLLSLPEEGSSHALARLRGVDDQHQKFIVMLGDHVACGGTARIDDLQRLTKTLIHGIDTDVKVDLAVTSLEPLRHKRITLMLMEKATHKMTPYACGFLDVE